MAFEPQQSLAWYDRYCRYLMMMAVRLGLHALFIEFTEQNRYSGNLPKPSIPGVFGVLAIKATSSVSTNP